MIPTDLSLVEPTTLTKLQKTYQFINQLDLIAINVKSSSGYLGTRLLMAYLTQAILIHQTGISITEIDAAAKELGMKYAPFPLIDEIGLEECLRIQESLADHYGYDVPQLLMQKVEHGIKGRQSGEGFYRYKKGKQLPPLTGMILKQLPVKKDKQTIKKQLLESLINESRICLNQGVIDNASDIDLISVAIVGFSAAKGGTLNYLSEQTVVQKTN
jgi:3-hydroxyacyl-CoA dehydrogenase/enoyl-CoA hydratase/3-hydroxybutyryl-CoA epimerase